MKTVLVTGAGGYIGSVLVRKLLEKGYFVKALDRFFFGEDKLPEHEHLQMIKEDSRCIKREVFEDVFAVIDLVAISNDPSGEMFQEATYSINYQSRVRTAKLAKECGVERYILTSSCSLYGFQDKGVIVDETSPINPLTTYAKANEKAEKEILPLNDEDFTVVVLRQATVFGYSPRMRFDLAINGMTYGAWKDQRIPLMRNGEQWRPMVHVEDTAECMCVMLEVDSEVINGGIFNVGSNGCIYQMKTLAHEIIDSLPVKVDVEWYRDPDDRSYQVSFDKVNKKVGWKATRCASKGAVEIYTALENGELVKNEESITLSWYETLVKWHGIIKDIEKYGGVLDIN